MMNRLGQNANAEVILIVMNLIKLGFCTLIACFLLTGCSSILVTQVPYKDVVVLAVEHNPAITEIDLKCFLNGELIDYPGIKEEFTTFLASSGFDLLTNASDSTPGYRINVSIDERYSWIAYSEALSILSLFILPGYSKYYYTCTFDIGPVENETKHYKYSGNIHNITGIPSLLFFWGSFDRFYLQRQFMDRAYNAFVIDFSTDMNYRYKTRGRKDSNSSCQSNELDHLSNHY